MADDGPNDHEEIAEQIQEMVATQQGSGSIDRNDMVAAYLPQPNQWEAKTALDLEDPGRIAALQQFGEIWPEVEDLQPVIDGFLETYLPAKTSIGGASRDEYKDIFQSMFGGKPSGEGSGAMLAAALGVDDEED